MKKVYTQIIAVFMVLLISCQIGGKKFPRMKLAEDFYDFGTMNNGDTVYHTFNFVNTGDAPLIISDVSTSCGCTVLEWTRKEIVPNDSGIIQVQFSKFQDPGIHNKIVIVKANTPDPYNVLKFSATIKSDSANRNTQFSP